MRQPAIRFLILLVLPLMGCASNDSPAIKESQEAGSPVQVDLDARRPVMMLSDYHLFADLQKQIPNQGVIAYYLSSSHFADYATSRHYFYLPPGKQAQYRANDVLTFPVGTVFVQTLAYSHDLRDPLQGERLVETRLLIHQRRGWVAVPYLWNDDQTDARRAVIGGKTTVRWIHSDGTKRTHHFTTPDMNQCKRCHKQHETVQPIGVRAGNLNLRLEGDSRNQLALWSKLGLLAGLPTAKTEIPQAIAWNDPSAGSVAERARVWLDVNCAHCHNPAGIASVSGLDLSAQQSMPVRFGVYKPPVAAGRGSSGFQFGILPGSPETSFLLHRIRSTDPGVMMPTVGRSLVDEEGTALIEQWIREMHADEQLAQRALNPVKAYSEALEGGDAARGRELFYGTAKCSSCHQAKPDDPGLVGPSLVDVTTRAKRDYLLESIVSPSSKIVAKYGATVLELVDGRTLSGIIASEDANELAITLADGTQTTLAVADVGQRTFSTISIMPSMANILSVQDVADLIEFLSTLKEKPGPLPQ